MRAPRHARVTQGERGFSMIEMLMTTFILAVGLLGLCMLQTMSMRASRGSRSLATAVQVGEGVLARVELEGRLSWLNITNNASTNTSLGNLNGLQYFPTIAAPLVHYDSTGQVTTDPGQYFFTVTIAAAAGPGSVTGAVSDFQVQVQFSDAVNSAQAAVPRTVTLTRRIAHG